MLLGIEHRGATERIRHWHLILQYVPMLGEFAALDPEQIYHNLWRFGPCADAAMNGELR